MTVKLCDYLYSGLVGCPEPAPSQVESHINLFLDEVTRIAYIRQKEERKESVPTIPTDMVDSIIECLQTFLSNIRTDAAKHDKYGDI